MMGFQNTLLVVVVSVFHKISQRTPAKIGLVIAFVMLAIIAFYANKMDRIAWKDSITGRQNYAYVHSLDGMKKNGEFLLYIQGIGYTPDVSVIFYSLDKYGGKVQNRKFRKRFDIGDENMNLGASLPVGRWEIDYRSRFSNWNQFLILEEHVGVLTVTTQVYRRGGTECIHCPDPQTYKVVEIDTR